MQKHYYLINTYVNTWKHIQISHMCIYKYVYILICKHIYMYTYRYVCMYIYICTYIYKYIYIYIFMYVHICVCMYTQTPIHHVDVLSCYVHNVQVLCRMFSLQLTATHCNSLQLTATQSVAHNVQVLHTMFKCCAQCWYDVHQIMSCTPRWGTVTYTMLTYCHVHHVDVLSRTPWWCAVTYTMLMCCHVIMWTMMTCCAPYDATSCPQCWCAVMSCTQSG